MADLSDFKRGQIVGAIITKAAELFGVARSIVLKIILMWIVRKDYKNIALKITAEFNDHLENPVSSKTVRTELHKAGFHGRAAIRKPY